MTPSTDVLTENQALRAQVAELQAQLSRKDNEVLDLAESIEKLQQQHDVLETFVFALERDHDRARAAVEAATLELAQSYEALRSLKGQQDDILGNVEQGIMTIDPAGVINQERSRATDRIFGIKVAGLVLFELFDAGLRLRIRRHVTACFSGSAQPAMLARLNPLQSCEYTAPDGAKRQLRVSFVPMARNDKGTIRVPQLLIVVDDLTAEHVLKAELERQVRDQAAIVERAYEMLTLPAGAVEEMLRDGHDTIGDVESYLSWRDSRGETTDPANPLLRECMRHTHTLKGNARALQLDHVYTTAHALEDALAASAGDGASLGEVRAAVHALRHELTNGQSMFDRLETLREGVRATARDHTRELEATLGKLVELEAQESGLASRLVIESRLEAALEPHVLFRVKNALIQIVRNAIAHGIEPAEVRVASGKPACATISIAFSSTARGTEVTCRDDGRGIDRDALRRAAISAGAITNDQAERLAADGVLQLLFLAGVTTRDHVDGLAGRGVGLEAVKQAIEAAGGTVEVVSEPGRFTEFRLVMPAAVEEVVSMKGTS